MKKLLSLVLFAVASLAHATTYTVTPSQSQATIQGIINGAVSGSDTVIFSAGSYAVSSGYTLKCGVTYTGPVATPSTAIMVSSFGQGGSIFNLYPGSGYANPCTQATTIEYFHFENSGGVYVQTSFTNLTIQHNQFTNLPCCSGGPSNIGIYVDGAQSTSNTAQSLTNANFSFNSLGDSASCTSPTNGMIDVVSPEDGNAGACGGMSINTTLNGLTINNNNFLHLGEAVHVNCPGGGHPGGAQPCEPTNNGVITTNITAHGNDFNQIHRIPWEEQPQTTSTVDFQNNAMHDWFTPAYFSFGVSFACCASGGSSPYLNVSNNIVIFNSTPTGRYGYGSEDWGRQATYNNNYIGSGSVSTSIGMAWGYGPVATMNNNTVCGGGFASAGYIADEGYGQTPVPTQTGSVKNSTCSAIASAIPSISPASGAASFPLTVTVTDAGYTSGPQPLGNTGIWYTTDGSTPVPGSGTAKYLATGQTFTLASAATVKAVGMWGATNQQPSYASGFGFTPSAVQTATYSGGGPPTAATPVLAPTSQTFTGSLSVSISDSTPGSSIYYTTDGSTPVGGGASAGGGTYYMSPTGSDSNNGLSTGAAWLTPNHSIACGSVINAAPGAYGANLGFGKWGTVTGCGTGSSANVAWVKCSGTLGTCTATGSSTAAVGVTASNWGVMGFQATASGGTAACFEAFPLTTTTTIHHIIFANDIASGCQSAGVTSPPDGAAGVDYLVAIGVITYNATQETSECGSGISIWEPKNSDTLAGTHEYVSQTFNWANINGGPSMPNCGGTAPTDGEGIIFDTWDANSYTGQGVAENNISLFNGNSGFRVDLTTKANTVFQYNTAYANEQDSNIKSSENGSFFQEEDNNVTMQYNISVPTVATLDAYPVYAYGLSFFSSTYAGNVVNNNQGYNTAHPAYFTDCMGSCTGFSFGSGNVNTNPTLTSPPASVPAAPNCSGFSTVPACMATIISDLTPTTPANAAWGYHAPSMSATADSLFPSWLCNVGLPSGLVSMPCSPLYTGPLTLSTTTTVNAIAAAPSYVNSAVGTGTYTVSTPILTGGQQGNTGSVNTLTVGAPAVQQIAIGNYSDGVQRNLPDAYGNTAVWSSSNTSILNVTSTGLISCIAAGSANSQVKSAPGGIVFNVWGWTCNSATQTVATPVLTPATENFSGTLSISIATSTAGAEIHYTTDGSTPTATSPTYTAPFNIVATTVVNAIGILSGYNPSSIGTATYTLVTPTISTVYLSVVGSTFVNYVLVGGTAHFQANIQYSDGVTLPSTTVGTPNARGDEITSWTTSNSGVGTITSGGVMTGVALGVTQIQAVINGGVDSSGWFEYVTHSLNTVAQGTTMQGVTLE